MNLLSILVVVYGWGFASIYPNYVRRGHPNAQQTFLHVYVTQLALLVGSCGAFSAIIGDWRVLLFGFMAATSVFATQTNNLLLVQSVRKSAYVVVAAALLNVLMLGAMMWLRPRDLLLAYAAYSVNSVVVGVISAGLGGVGLKPWSLSWSAARSIIATGFIPMLTNVLVVINYRIDVVMLGWLHVDYYYIGLYAVGVSVAEYCWVIPDAFKDVMINRTAKDKAITSLTFSLRVSMTILVVIFVVLVFACRFLISLAYGSAFAEASNVTILMLVGVYSMVYAKILGVSYLSSGRWVFYFRVLLIASIANVGLNLVAIPTWGIYGAATVSVATYTLAGAWFLVSFLRENSVRIRDVVWVRRADVAAVRHLISSATRREFDGDSPPSDDPTKG
ncbi:MAG: polysaccharide biosynthesis C-terminal domain-containing protein [Propionibacteriaceae bacterium]|nr:polysaccharide biosynthesis C-terminal domain-containing protein [Propionibacteriaceae bacterium]